MKTIACALLFLFADTLHAQPVFDLAHCINYAMQHNLSIRQAQIKHQEAASNLQSNYLDMLPALNLDAAWALQGGRAVSANRDGFIDDLQKYTQGTLQLSWDISNFFIKQKNKEALKLDLLSEEENILRNKNDIALQVMNGFIKCTYYEQQAHASRLQLQHDHKMMQQVQEQVNSGYKTEVDLLKMEVQKMNDSGSYLTYQQQVKDALQELKSLLFIDPQDSLVLQYETDETPLLPPSNASSLLEKLSTQDPSIRMIDYKKEALFKRINNMRLAYFPTLYINGKGNSNYVFEAPASLGYGEQLSLNPVIGYVTQGANKIDVNSYQASTVYAYYRSPNFREQINNNFNYSFSLGISIPLVDYYKTNRKISLQTYQINSLDLEKENMLLKLKEKLEALFRQAYISLEKMQVKKQAFATCQSIYAQTLHAYEVGFASTTDLLLVQNECIKSQQDYYQSLFENKLRVQMILFFDNYYQIN